MASKARPRTSTKVSKGATAVSAGEQSATADESSPSAGAGGSTSSSSSSSAEKEDRAGGVAKTSRLSPSTSSKSSVRTSSVTGSSVGSAESNLPLPAGWILKVDPATKKPFYVETATGARQWDRPFGGSSDAGFKTVAAGGAGSSNSMSSREKEPRGGDRLEKREGKISVGGRDRDSESSVRKTITSSVSGKGMNGPSKSGGGAHGSSGAFRMNEKKGSVGGKSKAHPSKTRGDEAGESAGDE